MGFLDNIKKRRDLVAQRKNIVRASKLKGLKAERIKYEGRAKIIKLEAKEKAKLKKAKLTVKEANRPTFLKNVQKRQTSNFKNNLKLMNDKPANNLFSDTGGYNPIFHGTGNNSFMNDSKKKKNEGGKGIFY